MRTIHHDGPLPRAEITRRTQLNRSTVGALVTELVDLGLAYETPPEETLVRGRPSPIVHPNSKVSALVINPDIDSLTFGLVGLGGVVHTRIRRELSQIPSPRDAIDLTVQLVEDSLEELNNYKIVGVGLVIPGLVRARDGLVRRAPYLDWTNEPFAEHITQALGLPAFAGNDAGISMISESLFGAGRGVNNLVYLNGFSVGIGGGVMVAGSPLIGENGYAAELGHTVVTGSSLRCHCGRFGCLETEVNLVRLRSFMGSDPVGLDELDAVLMNTTDSALMEEAARQITILAEAIANFISVFNPKVVLLGGFLGSLHAAWPDLVRKRVREASFSPLAENLLIERATLRSRLPLLGAAELAFTPLLSNPSREAVPESYPGPPPR